MIYLFCFSHGLTDYLCSSTLYNSSSPSIFAAAQDEPAMVSDTPLESPISSVPNSAKRAMGGSDISSSKRSAPVRHDTIQWVIFTGVSKYSPAHSISGTRCSRGFVLLSCRVRIDLTPRSDSLFFRRWNISAAIVSLVSWSMTMNGKLTKLIAAKASS